MKYGTVPGLDKPVSKLVLGSVVFGTETKEKLHTTFDLLDAFIAMGGSIVDTANTYGGGESERALGAWLTERGNRSQVLVLTKGAHPKRGAPRRVTPQDINADMEESLGRLHTDYVDLYLLHRDDPELPVGPIVECLNEHASAGRIRAFGGSNWSVRRIDQANAYATAHGLRGFSASSPNLSLAVPKEPRWPGCLAVDAETLAWHRTHQFPLFSWSSQAGGFFTGRFTPEDQSDKEMVRTYYTEGNWERFRRARELAKKKGCDALQIALAFVLNQPFPAFPLIGPATVDELKSSAAALDITLTAEELAYLDLGERE